MLVKQELLDSYVFFSLSSQVLVGINGYGANKQGRVFFPPTSLQRESNRHDQKNSRLCTLGMDLPSL